MRNIILVLMSGKLLFVAVPVPEALLDQDAKVSLAEHLFKEGVLSLGKAAKVAGMPYVLFSEHLSRLGIAVVDYAADELEEELRVAGL